jgi:hypothetical protein
MPLEKRCMRGRAGTGRRLLRAAGGQVYAGCTRRRCSAISRPVQIQSGRGRDVVEGPGTRPGRPISRLCNASDVSFGCSALLVQDLETLDHVAGKILASREPSVFVAAAVVCLDRLRNDEMSYGVGCNPKREHGLRKSSSTGMSAATSN